MKGLNKLLNDLYRYTLAECVDWTATLNDDKTIKDFRLYDEKGRLLLLLFRMTGERGLVYLNVNPTVDDHREFVESSLKSDIYDDIIIDNIYWHLANKYKKFSDLAAIIEDIKQREKYKNYEKAIV